MDYVNSRLQAFKKLSKNLEELIEVNMIEFDATIFTCKGIIMNIEEIMRISNEMRMKRNLNEKGPF